MSLPRPESIETERLTLRPLAQSDAGALHTCYGDAEVMRYWDAPAHETAAETAAFVARCLSNAALRIWVLTEKTGDGGALGWIVLRHIRDGVAETGFVLRRDRWRRGYMTEAAGAVTDHGFGACGLRRIQAETDPDNAASVGVLESLGFTQEGRLRAARRTLEGLRDSLIFGLLRADLRR